MNKILNVLSAKKIFGVVTAALLVMVSVLPAQAHIATPSAASKVNKTPLITKVGNGVYTMQFIYLNSAIVITDEGVLVMDTYNPYYAKMLKKEIAKLTDKPVKYVVYSHANSDHIRGASLFADTAEFIAQERQLSRLEYLKEDSFPMPDIIFDKELKLNLGGKEIILKDFGPNHSTGVTVMYLPEDKVITAQDLAYTKRWRYYGMADELPRPLLKSLREVQKLDFDLAITGHGPMATKADFIEHADFLEDLMTQVQAIHMRMVREGKRPFDGVQAVIKEVNTEKYDDWGFSEFRDLHLMNLYNSFSEGY